VASILRTAAPSIFVPKIRILSQRDYRTQPGVLTPGKDIKGVRTESGGREGSSAADAERDPQRIFCHPFSIPNPRSRVQFGQGAILQHFATQPHFSSTRTSTSTRTIVSGLAHVFRQMQSDEALGMVGLVPGGRVELPTKGL
jgi:hypothetical protein